MIVNISEAKAQLSHLVDLVYHGEEITIAKNNLPLVDLVPHKPEPRLKLGLLAGKILLPDNLIGEDPDINKMFYGEEE